MTEELELFYEDATEQLQYMENALLDASEGTDDLEKIGEIFRAMHTIKGTAGMFDFDEIVNFTHVAESLLDEVRQEKVALDSSLATLFMLSKDHTQIMTEELVNGNGLNEDIQKSGNLLKEQLLSYMSSSSDSLNLQDFEKNDFTQAGGIWRVSIKFSEDFFTSGMDIFSIFRYFNKLGEIVDNKPLISSIPLLDEINPLHAYIGFEIDFKSDCTKEDIEEIFEFVEDDVELVITKLENQDKISKKVQKEITAIEPKVSKKEEQKDEILKNSAEKKSFSLRVDSSKVDDLINKMSEMVIQNAKIVQMAEDSGDDELEEASENMTALLEEVRDSVMNIRMVRVEDSFIKFKRIVNDTAKKLGKDIAFNIIGGETELDKSVVEKLSDPLVHMLRNSIDHGIEMPEVRVQNGKNAKGTVNLRAYPDAGTIVVEIEDDGAGIDKERVLQKAIDNALVPQNNTLSEKEIFMLIFEAGLSTVKEVSNLSGRGVGMDVVKRNIEALRGMIEIDSEKGKGSKITIRLPLTLAIIDGFLFQAGKTKYIIPLEMIRECIELNDEYKSDIEGSESINIRDDVLPLLDIRRYFNEPIDQSLRKNVIVVKYGNYAVGLQVDEFFGEQQTVIKPLGGIFEHIPGVSGGSILGSGEVALIVDIPKLIEYKIKQKGV